MAPYFLRNLIPRREKRTEGRPLLEALASLSWIQWGHFWSGYVPSFSTCHTLPSPSSVASALSAHDATGLSSIEWLTANITLSYLLAVPTTFLFPTPMSVTCRITDWNEQLARMDVRCHRLLLCLPLRVQAPDSVPQEPERHRTSPSHSAPHIWQLARELTVNRFVKTTAITLTLLFRSAGAVSSKPFAETSQDADRMLRSPPACRIGHLRYYL